MSETSSFNTDEELKDDELTVNSFDEETGEVVEKKQNIGFDKMQKQRIELIDRA